IADGLARAHSAGIVHRDLKPENVMVTKERLVKILDFGLAKLTRPDQDGGQPTQGPTISAGTTPGIVMGTVGYMSPEQASGHPVDFRSDQFSFGSLLYEMATGKGPFRRATAAQTLAAIIQDEPEPIAVVNPKVPVPLRWVIEQCLAKDPRERYASTEDLARELGRVRDHLSDVSAVQAVSPASTRNKRRAASAIAVVSVLAVLGVGYVVSRHTGDRPSPSFHRLTFRRGHVTAARFSADGQTIVYDASWDGKPPELFTTRLGAPESRPLGLGSAVLVAVSSRGEMAFLLRPVTTGYSPGGTLAVAPLGGGAPRDVHEHVQGADWSPDGAGLAVVREVGERRRLEYPPGKVLLEVPFSAKLGNPRFSPRADRIAFVEGPDAGLTGGGIAVTDLSGQTTKLTSNFDFLGGLAWAPGGGELWFAASLRDGNGTGLYAVTLAGRQRLLYATSARTRLYDVSRDGRLLVCTIVRRFGILGVGPGDQTERDLSWLDESRAADLSTDGTTLLLSEQGAGGGLKGAVYKRKTDGSPAVRLGEGWGAALSSDGKWAVTLSYDGRRLTLLPTGAGEMREVRYPGDHSFLAARSSPDDRRLLLLGREGKRGARLYVGDWEGKSLRPISQEGVRGTGGGIAVSPDGNHVAAVGPDGVPRLYPVSGGAPRSVPALESGDLPLRFSSDGRRLFVARLQPTFAVIERIDLESGRRGPWKELRPSDAAGLSPSVAIQITPDGQHYAYTYRRILSDLILVDGLR
ncbi:MAG TPA: protein kinase, partial [Thermoanaerobaculia bacterium]|nr:protein kinase [Thermoanaerobaculia bacterium]